MSLDCGVLQDANLLFRDFLTWPEPYFSACKNLLNTIQQELRAPGKTEGVKIVFKSSSYLFMVRMVTELTLIQALRHDTG